MMKKHNKKILSDWLNLLDENYKIDKAIELPVLSGSMMPVLIPGKQIKINNILHSEIKFGDIIIFKDGRNLTAHRVLLKISVAGKKVIYQKGDMNRFGTWITGKKIIGYVHSAQNNNNKYINLSSYAAKKYAQKKAIEELIKTFWNIVLLLPRKIKQWQKKIKMNSV